MSIVVNGVASPQFHGSRTYNPARIWSRMSCGDTPDIVGGRTEEQRHIYMNQYGGEPQVATPIIDLRPFVSEENPAQFDVQVRANNDPVSMVTEVVLLDKNGNALGGAIFNKDTNTWSPLVSFVRCGRCVTCGNGEKNEENDDEIVDIELNLSYTVSNDTVTITGFASDLYPRVVELPDEIEGFPVVAIGNNAFVGTTITSMTIKGNVVSIGNRAFAGTAITSIELPNTLVNIGGGAFERSAITEIELPETLTNIGAFAFGDCVNLKEITIPSSVTSIGNAAFHSTGLTEVIIKPGAIDRNLRVGMLAFANIANLTAIDLGEVRQIDEFSFQDSGLTSVNIGAQITNIPVGAFAGTSLTGVTIPNSVTEIRDAAFRGTGLMLDSETVSIPDTAVVAMGAFDVAETLEDRKITRTCHCCRWNYELIYRLNETGDSITIVGLSSSANTHNEFTGEVIIPEEIGGVPVRIIGPRAFEQTAITSIIANDVYKSEKV
jgi:hypothetical protein